MDTSLPSCKDAGFAGMGGSVEVASSYSSGIGFKRADSTGRGQLLLWRVVDISISHSIITLARDIMHIFMEKGMRSSSHVVELRRNQPLLAAASIWPCL